MKQAKHVKWYRKNYPRPQFVREDFLSLDGAWDFALDFLREGEQKRYFSEFPARPLEIKVPFAYGSEACGVVGQGWCDCVWYRRTFAAAAEGKRVLLHFEGVDYQAKVWVNGQFVGSHTGAYARFSLDITDALAEHGENTLVVEAIDGAETFRPRGKQRWIEQDYGCWYRGTVGIWKSVWMERVEKAHFERVEITPDFEGKSVTFECFLSSPAAAIEAVVEYGGRKIVSVSASVPSSSQKLTASLETDDDVWRAIAWTPACPALYDVTFYLRDGEGRTLDTVGSYFGLRKMEVRGDKLWLNGEGLYLKMLLDQGYWRESVLTPPSEEAIEQDVLLTLEAGFNGIRKHQKIEDERFYYYCDVLGVLVWCEMPSAYSFDARAVRAMTEQWTEVVLQNGNHPSVVTWVPFNESWGVPDVRTDFRQQSFCEAVCALTRALDKHRRPVISNDGWEHTESDIVTIHSYIQSGERLREVYQNAASIAEDGVPRPLRAVFCNGHAYRGQPMMISEFGGISFRTEDGEWGYGEGAENEEEYLARYASLLAAISSMPHICGYCLTQMTDVFHEVNGILTMDRKPKVSLAAIKRLNDGVLTGRDI